MGSFDRDGEAWRVDWGIGVGGGGGGSKWLCMYVCVCMWVDFVFSVDSFAWWIDERIKLAGNMIEERLWVEARLHAIMWGRIEMLGESGISLRADESGDQKRTYPELKHETQCRDSNHSSKETTWCSPIARQWTAMAMILLEIVGLVRWNVEVKQ